MKKYDIDVIEIITTITVMLSWLVILTAGMGL